MGLIEDLQEEMCDRCMVCGNENPTRMRRTVSSTIGGAYAEMRIVVEYCADKSNCGEGAAIFKMEQFAAPFIATDLRRRGHSLFDLGIVETD